MDLDLSSVVVADLVGRISLGATVVDMRFVKPLDVERVLELAASHDLLVTVEENVVQGGKFAPIGQRGMFTSRQGYGVDDYLTTANEETALIVLIEDIAAYENLDEILTVDHIDAFFVAPSDFAASMGHIGDIGNADVQAKINGSLEKIISSGRTAGTLATNENVARFAEMGVKLFMTNALPWIASGAAQFQRNAGVSG